MSGQAVSTAQTNALVERQWGARSSAWNDDLRRQLLDVLLAAVERSKMTYEEFLAWADEDTLAEWVNGEVIVTSPASRKHQNIVDFLVSVMRVFVEHQDVGMVLSAPFQMKLEQGREPDLLFVTRDHLERLQETYLDGPADLVVEIASPDSVGRDRGEKFYEYEQAGIREYWLIDPQREQAEFYQLDPDGHYRLVPPDAEGVYRSTLLPGFWLRVKWLWQPPRVLEALRELGLI